MPMCVNMSCASSLHAIAEWKWAVQRGGVGYENTLGFKSQGILSLNEK